MEIKKIHRESELEFYALASKSGSIFSSIEWVKLHESYINLYGIFDENDKIFGGFYLYTQNIYGLKYVRNPLFTPSIGLFFENKSKNPAKQNSTVKKIMQLISDFIDHQSFQILSIQFDSSHIDMQPFIWKNFKVIPTYTYLIDLRDDESMILNNMASERRNDIKRAKKDMVTCFQSNDYQIIESIVKSTFDRKSRALDKNFLHKILFEFANPDNSFAFVSYQNDMPIACAFCIYDSTTAYYLLGGYDKRNKHQGAGSLALVNSIKYSKSIGIQTFDFEGSMLQEVEHYFRGFGGKLTPTFSVNKAYLPIEIALKFIKRNQF